MDLLSNLDAAQITYATIAGVLGVAALGSCLRGGGHREACLSPPVRPLPEDVSAAFPLLTSTAPVTDEADLAGVVAEMRECFLLGRTLPVAKRLDQLRALRALMRENERELIAALQEDLGRPEFECVVYDIQVTANEIDELIKHTASWARPQRKGFNILTFPSKNEVRAEPYGTVCVLSTWNYPVMLTLVPLAGAIAAGNNAVVKPSNVSPATARLLGRLLQQYMDPLVVKCVGPDMRGDRGAITALLEQHFDYIFFTGGPSVGKLVMRAASEHLTPVTLELGGKNPVFVAASANVDLAAKRTVWGRMFNAGQQCIAPDYVLVDKRVRAEFLERCAYWVRTMYTEDRTREMVGRIVNDRHFARIQALIAQGLADGGEMVVGGEAVPEERYFAPSVLLLPKSSAAMDDETFGPILMVCEVEDMDEAIRYVQGRAKSLSSYVFADSRTADRIISFTSSGGVTVNGTIFHCSHPELPFGGVGAAGMGAYHGRATFDTFSHLKPVLHKSVWRDGGLLSDPFVLYPPWSAGKLKMVRMLMKF